MLTTTTILMESTAALLTFGGFYEEEPQKSSIRLRFRILADWENSIVLSNGESVGQFPFGLNLYAGEPILGNQKRVQGGGGLLRYVPAMTSVDSSDAPACIDGWAAIGDVVFERTWRLLAASSYHVVRAEMCVGPVDYRTREDWTWDVETNQSLTIVGFSLTAATPSWYD